MSKKTASVVAEKMGVPEYKPTIDLDEKIYSGVKDLKIDDTINVTLKVKITNISRDRWENNKLRVTGTIENAVKKRGYDGDEDD